MGAGRYGPARASEVFTRGSVAVRQMTWEQAILRVLEDADGPLHYIEIMDRIVAGELRKSLGATPAATVASVLSTAIKREGDRAPWVRLGRGTYGPAGRGHARVPSAVAPAGEAELEERDQEEQYEVASSFGMYWSRDAVEWLRSPRILGKQYGGSTQVDFCNQIGVYLLYDGREVIYVGRATERGLGVRLYEHTWERLASRWDRFSWFGFLPVGEDGHCEACPRRSTRRSSVRRSKRSSSRPWNHAKTASAATTSRRSSISRSRIQQCGGER